MKLFTRNKPEAMHLILLSIVLLTCSFLKLGAAEKKKPNILLVVSDDPSWLHTHTSISGNKVIKTPVFDCVAKEGVLFNNAFTACSSWTPSLTALLCGQDIWRTEEVDKSDQKMWFLTDDDWRLRGLYGAELDWTIEDSDDILNDYKYHAIRQCNVVISKIPTITCETDDLQTRLDAEARFIRTMDINPNLVKTTQAGKLDVIGYRLYNVKPTKIVTLIKNI